MAEKQWYEGPFRVVPDIKELKDRPSPARGDIIAHRSGAVVLRCPRCGAMQFTRADILNDPSAPTLDRPIQCGSGHCKKCGIWFVIQRGRAKEVQEPEKKKTAIPDRLARAGVTPPPELKVESKG